MNIKDCEQTLMANRYQDKKESEKLKLLEEKLVKTKIEVQEIETKIKIIKKG